MSHEALLSRLEQVTARLEAFASSKGSGPSGGSAVTAPAASKGSAASGNPVQAYDTYVSKFVEPFLSSCAKYEDLKAVGKLTDRGWRKCKDLIVAAQTSKRPSNDELSSWFMVNITTIMKEAEELNSKKNDTFAHHLKSFAEGIQALSWVVSPSPKDAVEAGFEPADYILNKILTHSKTLAGQDKENHKAWALSYRVMMKELVTYVKINHKDGVKWNEKGGNFGCGSSSGQGSPAPPPAATAPTAPDAPDAPSAPDAPPDAPTDVPTSGTGGGAVMGAVFAELVGKGSGAKSATEGYGLKHVTRDMKASAHKDAPPLEPIHKKTAPAKAAKKEEKRGEPKLELRDGKTWMCEWQESKDMSIADVEMKQAVYITRCRNMTVTVPSKAKSIVVDKCERLRLVFDSVLATVEVVNSQRITVDCQRSVPAVAIDKSQGVIVILSKSAVASPPDIVTSNISECNLTVPGATDQSDPIEIPIPEQFCTRYNVQTKKIKTEPVSHGGG